MAYKGYCWSENNVISGSGTTGADRLLAQYARAVDLSLNEARNVVAGQTNDINGTKVKALITRIERTFGSLDVFKEQYGSLTAEAA